MISIYNLSFLIALFCGTSIVHAFSGPQAFSSTNNRPKWSSKLQAKTAIDKYLEDGNYNEVMKGNEAVLVDCCATWCGPCKLIDPFLVKASEKYSNELEIVKFDVEAKNGGIKMEFLLQGVMPQALPSLIFFRDGQATGTHTGALSQDELYEFIEKNLKQSGNEADDTDKTEKASVGEKGKISLGGAGKDDYML